MTDRDENIARTREIWGEKLADFIVKGRWSRALNYLTQIIDAPPSLFDDDQIFVEERQIAWMLRVNLLVQHGRYKEALAWILYEIDTNPNNAAANALRLKLRRILNLNKSPTKSTKPVEDIEFDWPGVAGMRSVKAMLERDILLPIFDPALFAKYKLSPPSGILFYGPPGCGKTHIARALAKKSGRTFMDIKPSDLGSIYIHGSQGKIRALFDEALEKAPCLLFIDELDALVPMRGHAGGYQDNEVNEFLVQLNNCAEREILVVGATNRMDSIDSAVIRPGRMDKKVFIGLPDIEARAELYRLCLDERPAAPMEMIDLARSAEGYTCAEIILLCDEAARIALETKRNITQIDLQRALKNLSPGNHSNDPRDWE
jgi:SpoVK/Ycf46/Vps4 family AAA+-type ATPase